MPTLLTQKLGLDLKHSHDPFLKVLKWGGGNNHCLRLHSVSSYQRNLIIRDLVELSNLRQKVPAEPEIPSFVGIKLLLWSFNDVTLDLDLPAGQTATLPQRWVCLLSLRWRFLLVLSLYCGMARGATARTRSCVTAGQLFPEWARKMGTISTYCIQQERVREQLSEVIRILEDRWKYKRLGRRLDQEQLAFRLDWRIKTSPDTGNTQSSL